MTKQNRSEPADKGTRQTRAVREDLKQLRNRHPYRRGPWKILFEDEVGKYPGMEGAMILKTPEAT